MNGHRKRERYSVKKGGRGRTRRHLGHLTHINERLLSAFRVSARESFAAGKFAPQSNRENRVDTRAPANGGIFSCVCPVIASNCASCLVFGATRSFFVIR